MKIFVGCSALDLRYRLGCTPSWWQLFKALHEMGHEVIVTPYLGESIESLWWRTYPNPCLTESKFYNWYVNRKLNNGNIWWLNEKLESLINKIGKKYVYQKWEKHLNTILKREKDVDALIFMNIPLHHIKGIVKKIRKMYSIPVGYFDGDMPTVLPEYAVQRGFKFNYYVDADLSEYDAFFTNSKGVIPELKELGARNIHAIYYAADPDLFTPIEIKKDIDISFFGYGSSLREEWINNFVTHPSQIMKNLKFSVAGNDFSIKLGNANYFGDLSFSGYRDYCCRSKICLNITRKPHALIYASSTARLFELAAFSACVVSQPYNGIQEWFESRKEIEVVDTKDEVVSIYHELLDSEDKRLKMGENARARILKDHTYRNRAKIIIRVLQQLK